MRSTEASATTRMSSALPARFSTLQTLRVTADGNGVATVTLSLPHGNALTLHAFDELHDVFCHIGSQTDIRAVVLCGDGKHFCSGINLKSLGEVLSAPKVSTCPGRRNAALYASIRKLQSAVSALEVCRVPVVVAIHGACLGGAVDLVAAADIRLATHDAVFGISEAELGFAADLGTLARLPRLVGEGRARELSLSCRRFSGRDAERYGLVTTVVDNVDALMLSARTLAAAIAAKSPLAMAATKAELLYGRDRSVNDALEHVAWRNAATLASDDLSKALMARATDPQGRSTIAFAKL